MSSSVRFVGTVPGRLFGGIVSEANPVTATAGSEIPDAIMTALSQSYEGLDEPDRSVCAALLLQRLALNKTSRAFLARRAVKAEEEMIREHEALKASCRAQCQVIETLKAKIIGLNQELQRIRAITTRSQTHLLRAKNAQQNLGRFSTREEVQRADHALVEAEQEFERARAAEGPLQTIINTLSLTELARENEKLHALTAQEARLRGVVTGQGYTDEEFGIVVPGRI